MRYVLSFIRISQEKTYPSVEMTRQRKSNTTCHKRIAPLAGVLEMQKRIMSYLQLDEAPNFNPIQYPKPCGLCYNCF